MTDSRNPADNGNVQQDKVTFNLPIAQTPAQQKEKEARDKDKEQTNNVNKEADKKKSDQEKKKKEQEQEAYEIADRMARNFAASQHLNLSEPQTTSIAQISDWAEKPKSGRFQCGNVMFDIDMEKGKATCFFTKGGVNWEEDLQALDAIIDHGSFEEIEVEFDWDSTSWLQSSGRVEKIFDVIKKSEEKGVALTLGPKCMRELGYYFGTKGTGPTGFESMEAVHARLRNLRQAQANRKELILFGGAIVGARQEAAQWQADNTDEAKEAAIKKMNDKIDSASDEAKKANVIEKELDKLDARNKHSLEIVKEIADKVERAQNSLNSPSLNVPAPSAMAKAGGASDPAGLVQRRQEEVANVLKNSNKEADTLLTEAKKERKVMQEKLDALNNQNKALTSDESKQLQTKIAASQQQLDKLNTEINKMENGLRDMQMQARRVAPQAAQQQQSAGFKGQQNLR